MLARTREDTMGNRVQLPLQTADLVAGFMVWVILSTLLPYIKQDVTIPPDMTALVTAVPVVLGSVLRIPFGYWANLVGARAVFVASFVLLLFPVWFISEASTWQELVVGGVFLGIGGAVFSVGVTSLPKYYPQERQGFVNGVYGLGNAGTALTTFGAPAIASQLGWSTTVKLYLVLLLVMAAVNLVLGDKAEPKVRVPLLEQLRAVKGSRLLWVLSAFYFVTFGAFVALTVFLPNFFASDFGLDGVAAGVLTGAFIVVAAGLRPLGGWLGDRFDCMRLLAGAFAGLSVGALVLLASRDLAMLAAGVYVVGVACGIGNGVVFKLVPQHFRAQAGPVNGIVAMMGGLGGFFPPFALQASLSATGGYGAAFVTFGLCAAACLATALWWARTGKAALR